MIYESNESICIHRIFFIYLAVAFEYSQGTPPGARHIPVPILFIPIFVLQVAGVLFTVIRLVEKIVLLLQSGDGMGRYFAFSSTIHDYFSFLHHGSR